MIEEQERPSFRSYEGARAEDAPLLAVAIGATASALEPLREFFTAYGGATGIAFVLIEHADSSSKGLLPSVLRQFTSLPVHEITEGQTLGADQVFVAPPSALVELEGATFHLRAPARPEQRKTPVDGFFRSLALSFGTRSVGIIFSGGGSDGMVGAQEITHEGGMTLAQHPEHSKYDGVPSSTIATGVVDRVLSPIEMARELLEYTQHVREVVAGAGAVAGYETVLETLPEICDLLQKATEHNFKHYKTSTLVRRIQRRMQVLRIQAAEVYVDRLRREPEEVTQLFRELLIGVTAFFRDAAAFDVLAAEVVGPLIAQRRGEPLRLWVPGCATGQEAYSLAIIVREALPHPRSTERADLCDRHR